MAYLMVLSVTCPLAYLMVYPSSSEEDEGIWMVRWLIRWFHLMILSGRSMDDLVGMIRLSKSSGFIHWFIHYPFIWSFIWFIHWSVHLSIGHLMVIRWFIWWVYQMSEFDPTVIIHFWRSWLHQSTNGYVFKSSNIICDIISNSSSEPSVAITHQDFVLYLNHGDDQRRPMVRDDTVVATLPWKWHGYHQYISPASYRLKRYQTKFSQLKARLNELYPTSLVLRRTRCSDCRSEVCPGAICAYCVPALVTTASSIHLLLHRFKRIARYVLLHHLRELVIQFTFVFESRPVIRFILSAVSVAKSDFADELHASDRGI